MRLKNVIWQMKKPAMIFLIISIIKCHSFLQRMKRTGYHI
ncbi:hypothetical protein CHCC20335_4290 [Bacillus paralicheniformis]|nr:hypothetical protein CHCC20335_4290 [Bacillus paralicheniformis]